MKSYYRIMLGAKSKFADECFRENYIGVGFMGDIDFTHHLPDNWRDFNARFIPEYLRQNPSKKKVTAGLACATVWILAKGILKGDIVLCPNGKGSYMVGEVLDDYSYHMNANLPHRRTVK